MANLIKLKRSAVAGRVPTSANLDLGELAINVRDGKLYFKRDDNTVQTILTTNTVISGDLNMDGDVTGSDVYIDGWGSVSGSLANIQAGHLDLTDIETVYGSVRNAHNSTIFKGTPLAVVAGQTSGNISDVVPADASDPALMPAVYIANEDILIGEDGTAIIYGRISGINTSAFSSGDTVYVAPGGGWTATKPVHPNKIQNLGIITKSHASNGGGEVMGAGRSNDVPNITPGKVLVGTATYPIESTAVHIDEANGRLGIGTDTPTTALEVIGDFKLKQQSAYSNYSVFDASEALLTLSTYSVNTSAYPAHIKFSPALTERMRITDSGNVGIGVTSPSDLLHIQNTDAAIRLQDSDGTDQWSRIRQAGSNLILTSRDGTSNGQLFFQQYDGTTTTDAMVIRSSGRVGIGTNSPSNTLHVNSGGVNAVARFTSTDGGAFIEFEDNSSTDRPYIGAVGNNLDIRTGGNVSVKVKEDGNVGIGTTTPTEKLDVAGNIKSSGTVAAAGAITSNGVDVLDNAVAMAIALG